MMKNKHLTLDDRYEVPYSLEKRMSFKTSGSLLGKDCTTISKEVRGHIIFEKKGAPYRPFNDCSHRLHCPHSQSACASCTSKHHHKCSTCGKCTTECADYKKEICPLLSKPPYVCNGCYHRNLCTLKKHLYDTRKAHIEYTEVLSESRPGFNLTEDELGQLNLVISPLLKNGQSLHHIMTHNVDRISCCERTAYIYVNNSLFDARNADMSRVVRFRPRKKKSVGLNVDKKCRIVRTYEDYKAFMESNPSLPVIELDSVEGIKSGAVLFTVYFVLQKLQLAFLRDANTPKTVTGIFNNLYKILRPETYQKLFSVLLADNGTEFSDPEALEFDENGNRRSYVFYCDPSTPGQKGGCKVIHEFIRRVIPKGADIGKYTSSQIGIMMDHINSYSRPELGDKSPYAIFKFYYGHRTLELLNVNLFKPNDIILRPSLLQ